MRWNVDFGWSPFRSVAKEKESVPCCLAPPCKVPTVLSAKHHETARNGFQGVYQLGLGEFLFSIVLDSVVGVIPRQKAASRRASSAAPNS